MIDLNVAHENFKKHLEDLGRAHATLIAYGKDIEQLVEYLLKKGVEEVQEIELDHLESFMAKLSTEDYTNKSISRKTNSTKTFFRFLKKEGLIDEDPARQLKHPKVEVKPPRILSKLEYRALRDVAREDTRTFALIETLLQTGISISELAGIKVEDLHLDDVEPYLDVPARSSKDSRKVPLNKAAVEAIREYTERERPGKDSDHLFITKTGNQLLVRNIRSTIDRFFRRAGIEDAKVNDLRHTFIAHHLEQGVSLVYISKVVGHKRVSTTERYLEYVERDTNEEKHELGTL